MINQIHYGDNREVLPDLARRGLKVHTCITSPPYYGLRDYGVPDQIGLEPSPEEYIADLVGVFGHVRELLVDSGTLWVVIGDSYAGSGGAGGDYGVGGKKEGQPVYKSAFKADKDGFKPKDLMGIPWMLAVALRKAGWYLRNEIIWAKGVSGQKELMDQIREGCRIVDIDNGAAGRLVSILDPYVGQCMPGPWTDRVIHSHETIFLFGKAPRYYADTENIREEAAGVGATRIMRSVWLVPPFAYLGEHFAAFPPGLVKRMSRIATSERGHCAACGGGWVRQVEKGDALSDQQMFCGGGADGQYTGQAVKDYASAGAQNASDVKRSILAGMVERTTVGWEPGCQCDQLVEPVKGIVLDPFMGSGTTAEVAEELGLRWVGVELNEKYRQLAEDRIAFGHERGRQSGLF